MLDGLSMKDELKIQLDPYFNDLKDFIKSTAKGSETALRKEFKEGLEANQNAIKSVKEEVNEIRVEMKDMEVRLSDKIDSIHTRLDEHEAKPINLAHPRQ